MDLSHNEIWYFLGGGSGEGGGKGIFTGGSKPATSGSLHSYLPPPFYGFLPLALFWLQNIKCCCVISPYFPAPLLTLLDYPPSVLSPPASRTPSFPVFPDSHPPCPVLDIGGRSTFRHENKVSFSYYEKLTTSCSIEDKATRVAFHH